VRLQGIRSLFEGTSRSRALGAIVALLLSEVWPREPQWPVPSAPAHGARASVFSHSSRRAPAAGSVLTVEDELIRNEPLCVASSVQSSGAIGETVLYRYQRDGDTLSVGYFVYFSTERPWGDNALTHDIWPALAIDAFYSHFLFVWPGAQRVLYGPADIEGALVRYHIDGERLVAEGARADDEGHHPVRLGDAELRAPDGHVALLTETWSHQLGAHGAVQRSGAAPSLRCFSGSGLAPLSASVAEAFRLGTVDAPRRAKPAWRASID
jgi:hypothetical protein